MVKKVGVGAEITVRYLYFSQEFEILRPEQRHLKGVRAPGSLKLALLGQRSVPIFLLIATKAKWGEMLGSKAEELALLPGKIWQS